jgi:hypothetical protein
MIGVKLENRQNKCINQFKNLYFSQNQRDDK